MEQFFWVLLGFMAVLACFDLFVGVSNDAVNFLTSALGSRIATYRMTMCVASLGVLLGATFSSGMMEIARSGVFHPQLFTFADIMIVFFAVMVSDVFLLDTFNSLGLPTSTTVSIIFELLGSAIAAATYKLWSAGENLMQIVDYINTTKALTIIAGILISVGVAFVCGTVVQYVARLIFTFHFQKMYRRIGGIYGGLALTAIFYFLVMKGASGASFMRPEWIEWIDVNTQPILITLFVGLSVVLQVAIWTINLNVFKIIILSGTFSLAFAFAGNDLVNFVGVPLAALSSVQDFVAHPGASPETFRMASLLDSAKTPTYFLLLSGLVMVFTLWFSKKAQRVVQTSINLSSSNAGEHEQFGSSLPGRLIVRSSMTMGKIMRQIVPAPMQVLLHSRFKPVTLQRDEVRLPFDYVRASINLVLSAILISSATALQLPLSTTYVTFMVAMGSSLADGAWDRESAVYRISGVLTVISGWFLTAFSACTLAGFICTLVMLGGNFMACALILLVVTLLIRSNFMAHKKDKVKEQIAMGRDRNSVCAMINRSVGNYLSRSVDVFSDTIAAFLDDNEGALRRLKTEATALFEKLSEGRASYYVMEQHASADKKIDRDARYCYYRAYTNMREVARELQRVTTVSKDHIANRHRVFHGKLKQNLLTLTAELQKLTQGAEGRHALEPVSLIGNDIIAQIDVMQTELLSMISSEDISMRGCELYLSFLQYARGLVSHFSIVAVLQQELNDICERTQEEPAPTAPPKKPRPGIVPTDILRALHVKKS